MTLRDTSDLERLIAAMPAIVPDFIIPMARQKSLILMRSQTDERDIIIWERLPCGASSLAFFTDSMEAAEHFMARREAHPEDWD